MKKLILALVVLASFALLFGCTATSTDDTQNINLTTKVATLSDKPLDQLKSEVITFSELDLDICTNDEGKPIIRLFSTTWCPHCKWINNTFNNTVQEYVNAGLIEAKHWEVDIRDDVLTPNNEGTVPTSEITVFRTYSEQGSVPTYVMGCKYYRIGNGYESQNDLASEEAEFRSVIEALIKETQSN